MQGFTPEQVREWYDTKVLGGKKVLAVFGDVDPAEAERLARKYLGKARARRGRDQVDTPVQTP